MEWKLEDGLKLIRALQLATRKYGYHLALGGSVLNKGESQKDLDLYFLPLANVKYVEDLKGMVKWLTELWGPPEDIGKDYEDEPRPNEGDVFFNYLDNQDPFRPKKFEGYSNEPKSNPYKRRLKFLRPGGDRIDVFIL